jgi:hypothetical protein
MSRTSPFPRRSSRLLTAAALTAGVGAATTLIAPGVAQADHSQVAIIQDSAQLAANPTATVQQMRALGATTIRLFVSWNSLAPDIQHTKKPAFAATDPAAYKASKWAIYDAIVRAAKADGLKVDFVLTGGAPRWAEGSGIPSNYVIAHNAGAEAFAWKPSAKDYGQFVTAVARRYDGHYAPKGQSTLPKVSFWTLWNEPNFGEDLGPQATDTSRISYAPGMYRNLIRAGWRSLHHTGHAGDTILIGDFAAHGSSLSEGRHGRTWPQGLPGNAGQTEPLAFIRTLYCLSQSGARLTGAAAAAVGCPTTAAGRARFRKSNPALFAASGVGDHPYANNASPVRDGVSNPEWATFPNIPKLEHTLDHATHAWGSGKRYKIYNDEYGYITDPPQTNKSQSVPLATAARYLNWAEYLSWRNPRIASYSQYLLQDGPVSATTGNAGFASGLYRSNGKAKPSRNAYRMPLWIPTTSLGRGRRFTIWGEARPAHWTGLDTKRRQSVAIQFRARSKGAWKTVATEKSDSYFEIHHAFGSSGQVRLRYTYPRQDAFLPTGLSGKAIVSRTVKISVR